MNGVREEILSRVRLSSDSAAQQATPQLPPTARVCSRQPGTPEAELSLLLATIRDLGGKTRRITSLPDFDAVLSELVSDEGIKKATVWDMADLRGLGVTETLQRLDVELVPPGADKRQIAACDVGITSVDAALAESGTLILASSPFKPPMVSLLPRIHLAIFRPSVLRADLRDVLTELANQKHFVLISGPSRTTDIEKVLALGVHGPKELYAWCFGLDMGREGVRNGD